MSKRQRTEAAAAGFDEKREPPVKGDRLNHGLDNDGMGCLSQDQYEDLEEDDDEPVYSGAEDEDDDADRAPPMLVESLGRGAGDEEYFRAVEWGGLRFQLGDTVVVWVCGEAENDGRCWGEVVWLWHDIIDNEPKAEVRWLMTPRQTMKDTGWDMCLPGEVFESDEVDEVPVASFDGHVDVLAPWETTGDYEAGRLVCRRHYATMNRAFMPLGRDVLHRRGRRARALMHSARNNQVPATALADEEASVAPISTSTTTTSSTTGSSNSGGQAGMASVEEEESLLRQVETRLGLSTSHTVWSRDEKDLSGKSKPLMSLPCREDETKQILDYVKSRLLKFYGRATDATNKKKDKHKKKSSSSTSRSTPTITHPPPSDSDDSDDGVDVETTLRSQCGAMYIGGMPGTGKTATVHHVLDMLRAQRTDLPFTQVDINGLRLSSPRQVYRQLWAALTNNKEPDLPASKAACRLINYFCMRSNTQRGNDSDRLWSTQAIPQSSRQRPIVLVLDEMDYLLGTGSDVLYNLLDWSAAGGAARGLILLGIANTLDLPERLQQSRLDKNLYEELRGGNAVTSADQRIKSRFRLTRVYFNPYNHDQVGQILRRRLGSLRPRVVADQAVGMCARKAGNASGDLRWAFKCCRHAIDLRRRLREEQGLWDRGHPLITIALVSRAAKELGETPLLRAVERGLTDAQILLMVALVQQIVASGMSEATLEQTYRRFLTLQRTMLHVDSSDPDDQVPQFSFGDVAWMAGNLASQRIIKMEQFKKPSGWTPQLSVHPDLDPGAFATAMRIGRPRMFDALPVALKELAGNR